MIPRKAAGRAADRLKGLGDKAKDIARWYGKTEEELKEMAKDTSLQMTEDGQLFYVCPLPKAGPGQRFQRPAPAGTGGPASPKPRPRPPTRKGGAASAAKAKKTGGGAMAAAMAPLDQTFLLHSRPSCTRKILLDFDGHTTAIANWKDGNSFVTPPYDEDGDTSEFSDEEKTSIQLVFKGVAEDYAPFEVDVTTEDPGVEGLRRTGTTDAAYGQRVCIGGNGSWGAGGGGVAQIGTFNSSGDVPCYIFSDVYLGLEVNFLADVVSHEAGHTLGLDHARTTSSEHYAPDYYGGHADWAPIMGVTFAGEGHFVTQWCKREYATAEYLNHRDEIATIASYVALRPDDYGNTIYESYPLGARTQGQIQGVIHSQTDADVFRFYTGAGEVYLTADAAEDGPDLNIKLTVYDGTGAVVATADTPTVLTPPADTGMSARLLITLPAGAYFVKVEGVGSTGDPTTGYDDYGSLGQYTLNGYWQAGEEPVGSTAPPANYPPVAVASASPASGTAPLSTTLSSAGSSDTDGTIASYLWDFGDGSATSTAASPSHTYTLAGTYVARLTLTDNVGATGTTTTTVTVTNPVPVGLYPAVTMTEGTSPMIDYPSGSYVNATKPTPHIVTVRFSFTSSVTGFTTSDIATTNCTLFSFSGAGSSYSARVNTASQGPISISVPAGVANATSGGAPNIASNVLSVIHDSIRPTATWTPLTGSTAESPVPLTLTFSEAPSRALTLADFTFANCTVASITPVSSTVFTVNCIPMVNPNPLYTMNCSVTALTNIAVDAAGNGNNYASIGFDYDIVVPIVTVTGHYHTTAYTDPDHVYFEVALSEPFSGSLDASDLEITNGTLGTISSLGGSPGGYVVQVTPTALGTVGLTVKAAALTDLVGNANVAASGSTGYELTAPALLSATVGGLAAGGSPLPVMGIDPIPFVFTFSEPVQWATTAYTTSVTNGSAVGATANGAELTLWVHPASSGTVSVDSLAVADLHLNEFDPTAATLLPAAVTFDPTVLPVITVSTSAAYSKTAPVKFEIQVSEPVTGLTAADLVITNGTVSGSLVQSPTDSNHYTATVTPVVGSVSCYVAANACTDASANANPVSNTASVVYDNSAPHATVLVPGTPPVTITNVSPLVFRCTFDEAVTWLDNSKIEIGNGTLTAVTAVNASTYDFTITPTTPTYVTCRVKAGAAKDSADNLSLASDPIPASIYYNNVGPAPALFLDNSYPGGTDASTFSFLVAREAFTGTLTASQFTVTPATHATKGALTLDSFSGIYSLEVSVSPGYQGPVTCSLIAGAFTDDLGNLSSAATLTVVRDSIQPVVTLGTPSMVATYSGPLTIPVTVADASALTFYSDLMTITSGGITASSKFLPGVDANHWTLVVYDIQGQGTMDVQVPSAYFQDVAGNNSAASNVVHVLIDKTPPQPVVNVPSTTGQPGYSNTFYMVFPCVFDDPVTWLDNSKVEVTNGTLNSVIGVGVVDGRATTYNIFVVPASQGAVTCRVNAGAAKNQLDYLSLASSATPTTVIYDSILPTTTITPSAAAITGTTAYFDISFSEAILNGGNLSGLAPTAITITNGTLAGAPTVIAGGYRQAVTVSGSYQGPVTCTVGYWAAIDLAGNTNIGNTGTLYRDTSAPTVAIGTPNDLYTSSGPVDIPVTITDYGPVTCTLTTSNLSFTTTGSVTYTATVLAGSDNKHWTVRLSSLGGEGTIKFQVLASACTDLGGRNNAASAQSQIMTVDKTAPALVQPGTIPTLAANVASITVTATTTSGGGFTLTPGVNIVTFDSGDAGPATTSTASSLVVPVLTAPTAGALHATVADPAGNVSVSRHIANIKPVVTTTTTNSIANTSAYLMIRGFGFDPVAANNSVSLTGGGITGTRTPLLATGTTLILDGWTGPLTNGNITATVTTNTFSSGTAVQVATAVAPATLDTLNTALVTPSGGISDVEVVTQMRDGKLLAGGLFNLGSGSTLRSNLARLTSTGSVDTSTPVFNAGASWTIFSVVVQPDGKILLGGDFFEVKPTGTTTTVPRMGIARLNADGTLDTDFNPNPYTVVTPYQNMMVFIQKIILQPDGKILVCGIFSGFQPNGSGPQFPRSCVARLNSDGTVDTTFDPNPLATDPSYNGVVAVMLMVRQENGQVAFAGQFDQLQPNQTGNPVNRLSLARVNSDGSVDPNFQPNPDGWGIESMAAQADGKLIVGGWFTQFAFPGGTVSRNYLARLNADGTGLDSTFDPQPNSSVSSLALQTDGRIFIGGDFSSINPNGAGALTRNRLARLKADGTVDSTWILPNPNSSVYTLTGQDDGKLLVGGNFTSVTPNGGSATARKCLMRVHNDSAAEAVVLTSLTEVSWYRYGACPEIADVTFEKSTDGGTTWTLLGPGTRIGGTSAHWQCTGLSLPATGQLSIRARGNAGSQVTGGSSYLELIQAF